MSRIFGFNRKIGFQPPYLKYLWRSRFCLYKSCGVSWKCFHIWHHVNDISRFDHIMFEIIYNTFKSWICSKSNAQMDPCIPWVCWISACKIWHTPLPFYLVPVNFGLFDQIIFFLLLIPCDLVDQMSSSSVFSGLLTSFMVLCFLACKIFGTPPRLRWLIILTNLVHI